MSYTLSSVKDVQQTMDNAQEYHIDVTFDISTYFKELNEGDALVRVYVDNDFYDNDDEPNVKLYGTYYMSHFDAKQLTQP